MKKTQRAFSHIQRAKELLGFGGTEEDEQMARVLQSLYDRRGSSPAQDDLPAHAPRRNQRRVPESFQLPPDNTKYSPWDTNIKTPVNFNDLHNVLNASWIRDGSPGS